MLDTDFADFAENLFQCWLKGTSLLPPAISQYFQMEYIPEPYLLFGNEDKPLLFLTTNPGNGEPFQHRPHILSAASTIINPALSYKENSRNLAKVYYGEAGAINAHAASRIKKITMLADKARLSGVLQLETIPFHSADLPMSIKKKWVNLIEEDSLPNEYTRHIRRITKDSNTLLLTATSPIAVHSNTINPWLKWQLSLLRFDISQASFVEFASKNGKPTAGAFVQRNNNSVKVVYCSQGALTLPSVGKPIQQLSSLFLK